MPTFSGFKIGGSTGVTQRRIDHEINIATVKAANSGLTTNDKITLFDVPANTLVRIHQIEIKTAGTIATRLDVGDNAADTTWVNNATTLTTGTDLTLATTSKFYGAADAVTLKLGNAATTGVVRIIAEMVDTNQYPRAVPPTYTWS